jgi:hypothetical protein
MIVHRQYTNWQHPYDIRRQAPQRENTPNSLTNVGLSRADVQSPQQTRKRVRNSAHACDAPGPASDDLKQARHFMESHSHPFVDAWHASIPVKLTPGKVALTGVASTMAGSFREFVREAWKIVVPGNRFIANWHIDAICEHLEAVTLGKIRDLLINIPPRHMKSLAVGVFWPAWEWINHPERRFLFASYARSLSLRDSNHCRLLIQSP